MKVIKPSFETLKGLRDPKLRWVRIFLICLKNIGTPFLFFSCQRLRGQIN